MILGNFLQWAWRQRPCISKFAICEHFFGDWNVMIENNSYIYTHRHSYRPPMFFLFLSKLSHCVVLLLNFFCRVHECNIFVSLLNTMLTLKNYLLWRMGSLLCRWGYIIITKYLLINCNSTHVYLLATNNTQFSNLIIAGHISVSLRIYSLRIYKINF